MKDGIDYYSERKRDEKDWYVSVRLYQIILSAVMVLALFISCGLNSSLREKVKEGYEYLTEFSLTEEDFFNGVNVLKNYVGLTRDA
ncbi:MAG: hypothetical protein PUB94_08085 [Oscillospiraceae bacterium]|nr:hypothetical protein [Oscillospiraceae bacterium]